MRRYSLILILFLVSCSGSKNSQPVTLQPVKTTIAQSVEYVSRDFAAMTMADDAVTLAFKLSGRVVDVPVAKGMSVSRGATLAELDSRDVELQVDAAYSAYREALSRLDRARRLFEHDAISAQEVESLENGAKQAESVYRNTLDLLADTRIVAPFDGVIERVYVDTYERVSSGQPIVRIVRPLSTTVGFTAPEYLLSYLALPTTQYRVEFDAFPGVQFRAEMKSFARTSSDALGFPVSLRLVDIDTMLYRVSPGMTCIATVITPESDRQAVVLPLTAIYAPMGDRDYVWVVDGDNRVHRRSVTLGNLAGDSSVVVLAGVESGECVVVAGVYHLMDNQQVEVID